MNQDNLSVRSSPSAQPSHERNSNNSAKQSPNGKDPSTSTVELPNFLKWIAGVRAFLCTACEMLVGLGGMDNEAGTLQYSHSLGAHLRENHAMQVDQQYLVDHTLTLVRYSITNNIPYVPFSPSVIPRERLPLPVVDKALLCPKSSNACGFVALNRPMMLRHYAQAHPNEALPPNPQHCSAQLGFQETYVRVVDEVDKSIRYTQLIAWKRISGTDVS